MSEIIVSRKYSRALYELSEEKGVARDVLSVLEYIDDKLKNNPKLSGFVEHLYIDRNARKKVLQEIVVSFRGKVPPFMPHFLEMLIDKRRITALAAITDAYRDLYRKSQGVQPVKVITPTALTKRQREKLTASMAGYTGKTVLLEDEVAPDMIAGMVIKIGTKVLDCSLSARLNRISEHLRGEF